MDWNALKEKGNHLFSRYKYVLLVLVVGLVLMSIPTDATGEAPVRQTVQQTVPEGPSEKLEQILSQIEGVGKVQVLLTEASSAETIYQTDEDTASDGSFRVETVIITDENRAQNGLVKTVTPPVYLGAIIVCQGADRPSVQLAIIQAVSNVTGISTDRITVLKMK